MVANNKKRQGNPNITQYGHETRFKPGQSGNPAGFPKGGVKFSHWYTIFADMTPAEFEKHKPKTAGEQLAYNVFENALGQWADSRLSRNDIIDRCEGKVPDKVHFRDETEDPEILLRDLIARGYKPDNPLIR